MPAERVVIVADAHLRHAGEGAATAFHRFLSKVPRMADHLVVNGDLFDFWFEYERVIPRHAFATLAALSQLRTAGVSLTVSGGNHDRWGGDFWTQELGARFYPEPAEIQLAGFRVFLAHGDGLSESRTASRVMHHVTRMPLTVRLFRWIHPDIGFWLADRMSGSLAEQTKDPASLDRAAHAQRTFALDLLGRRSDLDLVILSHTHRPALVPAGARRWYVNPGAWVDGGRYAILGGDGPELSAFTST